MKKLNDLSIWILASIVYVGIALFLIIFYNQPNYPLLETKWEFVNAAGIRHTMTFDGFKKKITQINFFSNGGKSDPEYHTYEFKDNVLKINRIVAGINEETEYKYTGDNIITITEHDDVEKEYYTRQH